MDIDEQDLIHEGRISTLEAKVDEVLPLIKDLHKDLLTRKARWQFLTVAGHYVMWAVAGIVSFLGIARSDAISGWLFQFPKH